MRHTMQKTPVRSTARRVREEVEEAPRERVEIRADIRRLWWPESDQGPVGRARRH
ncbi:hypothetical protein [Streptomyces sp. NPDC050560]|uniref:hypothetical protein n=1 Tax=Streptomyces sp. NPDC050560 TaxID=3365630 RepID=UPI0037BACBF4